MSIQAEKERTKAYNFLKSFKPADAKQVLDQMLVDELENEEVLFAISCCSFWIDIARQCELLEDPLEKAELLLNEWKSFLSFLETRPKAVFNETLYAIKCGIFTSALNFYNEIPEGTGPEMADVLRKKGLCYKKLGEYETATECLAKANSYSNGSAPILAELADCYALCAEERQAKVLFREAFYIDAERIEIAFLDSELINCLIRSVKEKGYTGAILLNWVPVYGQLFGVFSVKRRLRPQEVGRLKQDIYAKENELKEISCVKETLVPKLINLYFWLIDYYVMTNEEIRRINDILTRIKILDPKIYELYVK